MLADHEPRRVLIMADPSAAPALRELFDRTLLTGWEALEAADFEQGRFTLQHQACDVLLVDDSVYKAEDVEGIAWLARQHELPLVLLAWVQPGLVEYALKSGVSQWLPHDLVLQHPLLLAAALNQAAQFTDLRRRIRQGQETLRQSRRHIDRLIGLLWRTLPADVESSWFTQRHVLERFQEEVSRAQRYGHDLTVVLGEVEAPTGEQPEVPGGWLAQQIIRAKRSCDVAGQYGPHGFMLLLVHTTETGGVACCRRLQNLLGQPSGQTGAQAFRVYFGVAGYSKTVASCKALLSRAEQLLGAARNAAEGLGAAI
jgi:hypothetical protein